MPRSATAHRQDRDVRLAAYRHFAHQHGWTVLGLHEDLSRRYPVAPLLGAHSAQAELALTGHWEQWDAVLASVLVRPPQSGPSRRPTSDTVVQLTMLDTGPDPRQFTALLTDSGLEFACMTASAEAARPVIERLLTEQAAAGSLCVGDQLAATEIELLHARTLDPRRHAFDLTGPLRVLSALATSLA